MPTNVNWEELKKKPLKKEGDIKIVDYKGRTLYTVDSQTGKQYDSDYTKKRKEAIRKGESPKRKLIRRVAPALYSQRSAQRQQQLDSLAQEKSDLYWNRDYNDLTSFDAYNDLTDKVNKISLEEARIKDADARDYDNTLRNVLGEEGYDLHKYHQQQRIREAQRKEQELGALNFLMPSQHFGAIFDAFRSDNFAEGYINSIMNGNSGFVDNKTAKNSPVLSAILNFGGDILAGGALTKGSKYIVNGAKDIPRLLKTSAYKAYRTPLKALDNSSIRGVVKTFKMNKDKIKNINNYPAIRENNLKAAQQNRIRRQLNNIGLKDEDILRIDNEHGTLSIGIKDGAEFETKNLKFTNPITGETFKAPFNYQNINKSKEYLRDLSEQYKDILVTERGSQHFISRDNPLSVPIQKYVDDITTRIGDDGIVGGSSIIYGKNYAAGVPNDLELITTESRLNNLYNKVNGKRIELHKGAGYRIDSDLALSDSKGVKQPFDVQVIEENNGRATGSIAHGYYSYLHPEKYNELVANQVNKRLAGQPGWQLQDINLPISAEQLYKEITPEVQRGKVLFDTFISDADKHTARAYQMLTHDNASIRQLARQQMRKQVEKHFGKNYKFASEEYPNLRFDNVEANKEFLKKLGLNENYASNPEMMKNIVDRWHIAETTQSRTVSTVYKGEVTAENMEELNQTLQTVYSATGWKGSGLGGNTTRYIGGGGVPGDLTGIMKQRLTFYPERMNTPLDLIKQNERLKNFRNNNIIPMDKLGTKEADVISGALYKRLDRIEDRMVKEIADVDPINDIKNSIEQGLLTEDEANEIAKKVKQGKTYKDLVKEIYRKGLKEHEAIAREYDIPMYQGDEYTVGHPAPGRVPSYSGNVSRPEIGSIYPESGYFIGNRKIGQEIGGKGVPRNSLKEVVKRAIRDYSNPEIDWIYGYPDYINPTKLEQDITNILRNENRYNEGVDIGKFDVRTNEIRSKLLRNRWRNQDRLGKLAIGLIPIGLGAGGYAAYKYQTNKNINEFDNELINLSDKVKDVNNPKTWTKKQREKYYKIIGDYPETYNIFNDSKELDKEHYKKYKEHRHNKRKQNKK